MQIQDGGSLDKAKDKIFHTFSEFMTRITELDELVEVGNRLLVGFQQGLEYIRRQPIENNSELVEHIIRDNECKRLSSYIEAGCLNCHDTVHNLSKSKCIVDELARLLKNTEAVVQTLNCSSAQMGEKFVDSGTDTSDTSHEEEEGLYFDPLKYEVTGIATMMAIVYSMVKKDYTMQEKIVSSINFTSSSGELGSYSDMWSLRPYIDDEIMLKAWKLVY